MSRKQPMRASGQRQLQVGEEIRHALAEVFTQGKLYHPDLDFSNLPVTVSEVRISPDLKNGTVFVMTLGGNPPANFISVLNELSPQLRTSIARKVNLRFSPRLSFKLDNSFDNANKINQLLDTIEEPGEIES